MTGKQQIEQIVINRTECPNSFSWRWGKTGDEAKVYFEGEEDLIKKIKAVEAGIKEAIKLRTDQ